MIFALGGGKKVNNILSGATWDDGYLNSSGTPTAPDATKKERYTVDYLTAAPGNWIVCTALKTTSSNFWVSVANYKSDQSYISRLLPNGYSACAQDTESGLYIYAIGITLPANTAYVRFSSRTYGEGYAYMTPAADFAAAIKSGTFSMPFVDMWG